VIGTRTGVDSRGSSQGLESVVEAGADLVTGPEPIAEITTVADPVEHPVEQLNQSQRLSLFGQ
jgi:hypothetical protein